MSADTNMTPQLAIRKTESLPEQPLKTSPRIGYALFAESEKRISPRRNKALISIFRQKGVHLDFVNRII